MRSRIVKFIAVFLIAVMGFMFVACGSKADYSSPQKFYDYYSSGNNCVGITVEVPVTDEGDYTSGMNALGIVNVTQVGMGSRLIFLANDSSQLSPSDKKVVFKITRVEDSSYSIMIYGDIVR